MPARWSCVNRKKHLGPGLAFDAIKIDRSFVNDLIFRPATRAFVQSILTRAHNLGMKVIVEGIETKEQLELIELLGANEAQGFLLGLPTADPIACLLQGRAELERPLDGAENESQIVIAGKPAFSV
jgi:EAL domain-containing protein (putative c-di-GMP-specific phosphodiesterase class I)